jgi:TPR repeat protein
MKLINNKMHFSFNTYYELSMKGDLTAQYNLTISYYTGILVQRNFKQARYWLEKLYKNNKNEAIYYLFKIYEDGQGCKKDINHAIYYTKSLKSACRKMLPSYVLFP